ncbi:hypothetical protein that often co-occurs with aconitase [uncultured Candidatus Thioglobus sp.]|nr:hypothetical protein that often co-occurs with aconitase [uncultured Candidatus Thioglobus sp.]SMN00707.1 hypothetical protein that often co-occurs with aconitase [uncultured Candidatus Thioglobus sp.]
MNFKKINLALWILLFANAGLAKDLQFESGDYQNTLIELYTSEGCSSCPPADKWLSKLKQHPKLFSEIIPIAFHVDYWDYIGWQDKFASSDYSERQKQYAQQGGISQMYTPQVVKNGKEDRSWRYQKSSFSDEKVGKLSVNVLDGTAYITFKPTEKQPALVAHIALLGSGLSSTVTAGENEDKILKHDFVVLNHTQKTSKVNRWSIKLPESSHDAQRFSLAVWVSAKDSLKPIQVVGSWL